VDAYEGYSPRVADWSTVRSIASGLPEVEEDTTYGKPSFRIRGKLFAWMSPSREAEGAFVVRVDPDEKDLLIQSNPAVYFSTPHYRDYPAVLIRLEAIQRAELAERIEDSWLLRAPRRLVAEFLAEP
jgi:hypothetical protein